MEDIVIALASKAFVNGDVPANLATMLDTMAEAAGRGAELVCFGEAFLQGFDGLCWDYGTDRAMALTRDDAPILRIREASRSPGVDVMFGFIEREGEGAVRHLHAGGAGRDCMLLPPHVPGLEGLPARRRSLPGGHGAGALPLPGMDVRHGPVRGFVGRHAGSLPPGEDILFLPVYCGYTPETWRSGARAEYAARCRDHAPLTLFIDGICEGDSQGGCAAFRAGETVAELPGDGGAAARPSRGPDERMIHG